jgi:hypothetical protein
VAAEEASVSLLELARTKVRRKGPQCSILTLIYSHPDRRNEIHELLDNSGKDEDDQPRGDGLPYSVAAETLSTMGSGKVLGDTVSRHIRGRCGCP